MRGSMATRRRTGGCVCVCVFDLAGESILVTNDCAMENMMYTVYIYVYFMYTMCNLHVSF